MIAEEVTNRRVLIDGNVKIAARDRDVGMASRIANLGQRPTTRQGMRDESVPPMMDCQGRNAFLAEPFTS
jgi:hypothetical protein